MHSCILAFLLAFLHSCGGQNIEKSSGFIVFYHFLKNIDYFAFFYSLFEIVIKKTPGFIVCVKIETLWLQPQRLYFVKNDKTP